MCGICGAVSFSPEGFIDAQGLQAMCQLLRHRGPDAAGYYVDAYAALGMRRLSIIDLASGDQPITNEDRTCWVVFNGEIYNYRQLRLQLEQRDHVFVSQSDTEVIIHAYEEYGDQCVELFNGMFAFAIWDSARRRLLLARDHLGIKPLYYWTDGHRLIFGSELKAVLAHPAVPRQIDPFALDQFLTLEYIPAPHTILRNVRKLPAGHRLVMQDQRITVEPYWDIPLVQVPHTEGECAEALTTLLDDAVRAQLMSDVPLGVFLSGGLDSSTVVACMRQVSAAPIRTFSIGFDDQTYNELPYARAVAAHFGTDHAEAILQPDIATLAERLVAHMDEPFGDFSIFPTYLVSELASRDVKVVLSGDGGDEVFAGYDTYVAQRIDRLYGRLPRTLREHMLPALLARVPPGPAKKGLINKAKRFVEGAALPEALGHARWMLFMSAADKADLYQPDLHGALADNSATAAILHAFQQAPHPDPLARQQYVDLKTYLAEDILTKVDRMSMAASIEARVPLLDYRIAEFALSLPAHMKLHRGRTKTLLRRAMAGRLPAIVLNQPKRGFSIPLKHWLCGPLRPMLTDLLAPDRLRHRGLFQPHTVTRWVTEHLSGQANHSHRLWALMVLELWYQHVLECPPVLLQHTRVSDWGLG